MRSDLEIDGTEDQTAMYQEDRPRRATTIFHGTAEARRPRPLAPRPLEV